MTKQKNNAEREVMVSHQSDLLTQDLILTGIFKNCKFSDYGYSFDFPLIRYEHGSGDISYPTWQVEELKSLELSEKQYEKLIIFLETELNSYKNFLKNFENQIKTKDEREKKIAGYFDKSLHGVSTIPYFAFELSLIKKLEMEGVSPKDIPSSLTDTSLASIELENIFKIFKTELESESPISESLKKELKKFCDRFGYLGLTYFKGNPWTIQDAYRMLFTAENKHEKNGKPDKKMSKHVEFASKLLKLRTLKWELMCMGTSLFRKFVKEFFSEEIVYEDLLNLRVEEVLDIINGKYSKEQLGQGRDYFILEIKDNGVFMSTDKKEEVIREKNTHEKEINGVTAHHGKVVGKAKIVLSPKEGYKVEQGDVLVTKMSTPDFLPAMKKASAFVTDIGGITSHAAIVSREMKKPCIIGTKNATKVLHDGDLIEVDADNGKVTILEKTKGDKNN